MHINASLGTHTLALFGIQNRAPTQMALPQAQDRASGPPVPGEKPVNTLGPGERVGSARSEEGPREWFEAKMARVERNRAIHAKFRAEQDAFKVEHGFERKDHKFLRANQSYALSVKPGEGAYRTRERAMSAARSGASTLNSRINMTNFLARHIERISAQLEAGAGDTDQLKIKLAEARDGFAAVKRRVDISAAYLRQQFGVTEAYSVDDDGNYSLAPLEISHSLYGLLLSVSEMGKYTKYTLYDTDGNGYDSEEYPGDSIDRRV